MVMKCAKCGHDSDKNRKKGEVILCDICLKLSPDLDSGFESYVQEKIDGKALDVFRKYQTGSQKKKKTMAKMATKGNLMSRAPFGYETQDKKLVPAQNYLEVEEIFEEFLNTDISLTKLAEKHKLSVNGLKKILKNFTYIGKIKFGNQAYDGGHKPIISTTLFNHVQN